MKHGKHAGHPGAVDFSDSPFLVIWETTRSCGLACLHCRAEAIPGRDPGELTTEEGERVIEEVASMRTPIFILSGGDPLNRPDLDELVAHGKAQGLRMGTIPAATELLTQDRVRRLAEAGLDQVAFSIDGPSADTHDRFRGVPGSFDKTVEGVDYAHQVGLPVQINTCFAAWNFEYLEDMVTLAKSLDIVFWEVFFLIPTGRATEMSGLTPAQFETVFDRLHRLNREASFIVKLTEAPHYRRFVIESESAVAGDGAGTQERIDHILARPRGVANGIGMSPKAVNSGKGFLFVDHLGNIFPSGFLPVCAGNIRRDSLAAVYRDSPLFRELRDPGLLKGKCGACEYADVCGGSRARAHAMTGDYLASDPGCAYTPPQWAGA